MIIIIIIVVVAEHGVMYKSYINKLSIFNVANLKGKTEKK